LFGRRQQSTDVNLIDASVRRSSLRRAKVAFIVAEVIGWALAAILLSGWIPVALAILAGPFLALPVAGVVFLLVWVWPVLRIIIHWFTEIGALAGILAGSTELAGVVPGQMAAVLVVGAITAVLAVPYTRALVWCVIARHRLRMSFAAFIRGNREGTLPFILHAVPTPVGERVWVWLRPGLSLGELRGREEQLAVSCWASEVSVEQASSKYAALLRFDIKRRNSFTDQPVSPLLSTVADAVGRVPSRTHQPSVAMAGGDASAVELDEVTAEAVADKVPASAEKAGKPAGQMYKPTPKPAAAPGNDAEDDGAFWA